MFHVESTQNKVKKEKNAESFVLTSFPAKKFIPNEIAKLSYKINNK